jgi:hypothetical protein
MELTTAPSPEQMKRFLYGEMSESESNAIEERLFVDTEFFHELKSFENDLIDSYVRGKLSGEDLKRFERSLTKSEELTTQVNNARALQRYIAEQRKAAAPAAGLETSGKSIWSRLFILVSFQSPAMHFAMIALVVLMGIVVAWLLYDSSRVRRDLAKAQSEKAQRVGELQNEIEAAKQQIETLEHKVNEQSGKNEQLYKELHDSEAKLLELERELERVGSQYQPSSIVSATITSIGSRGGSEQPSVVRRSAWSVTVQLPIVTETDYDDYEIKNNDDKEIPTEKKVISRSGKKYLLVTLPAKNIQFSVIGIMNETGIKKKIEDYRLEVRR